MATSKFVAVLLCAVVAGAAARHLSQAQMSIVPSLPATLQSLNARIASTDAKTSPASLLSYYYDIEEEYKPAPKYAPKPAYKPVYETEEDSYEKKEDTYEKEDSYEPKYEEESYSYGPNKIVTKMYEKSRTDVKYQTLVKDPADPILDLNKVPLNLMTYSFTSYLTCQDPHDKMVPDHEDGVIALPIVAEHMKLVTIGQCVWSVTETAPQVVSAAATLKGSNSVVCKFNEEACRYCKNGDYLKDGLTVSGQGLIYAFTDAYGAAKETDVFLALINGVVGAPKNLKLDNGAIQYFYGAEKVFPPYQAAASAYAPEYAPEKPAYAAPVDPTGSYTFVLKH